MSKKSNYKTGYVSDKDFDEAIQELNQRKHFVNFPVKSFTNNPKTLNDYYVELPTTVKAIHHHHDGTKEEIQLPFDSVFGQFHLTVNNQDL